MDSDGTEMIQISREIFLARFASICVDSTATAIEPDAYCSSDFIVSSRVYWM